jgi:DNA-binding CsgD family transcriptional regulator
VRASATRGRAAPGSTCSAEAGGRVVHPATAKSSHSPGIPFSSLTPRSSRGDALLAPAITRRLIAEFARLQPRQIKPEALSALTARETEILGLVAEGLSNREIASRLVLSDETVKTHVSHVLRKLGLRDRAQAVVVAYESGLVVPRADS